jgi:large subunit ribosomal protein L13
VRVTRLPDHVAPMTKTILRQAADLSSGQAIALEELAEPMCFTTEGHRAGAGRAALSRASTLKRRRARAWHFRVMKTYVATPADRERNWYVVDASGQTLGRLATQIANALRGKRKPTYTPHVDVGDFVIVVNAERIQVTGNKRNDKRYYRHSGYPGGLKSRTLQEMLDRRPEEVIRRAVKGMLPRNRLGRKQLTKLKVYAGPDHPHVAQQPQQMEIDA